MHSAYYGTTVPMTPEEEVRRVIKLAEKKEKEKLMRGDYPGGMGAYLSPAFSSKAPSVVIDIQKLENGYMLTLTTNPEQPKPRVVERQTSPFVGQDPDEIIDKMIDGFGAVIRAINDKGAGESWKDDEDRAQIREAFRVMFPGVSRQIDQVVSDEPVPQYIEPRHEQLVFETKQKLFEYLMKEL
jgi:hypothetical protein